MKMRSERRKKSATMMNARTMKAKIMSVTRTKSVKNMKKTTNQTRLSSGLSLCS